MLAAKDLELYIERHLIKHLHFMSHVYLVYVFISAYGETMPQMSCAVIVPLLLISKMSDLVSFSSLLQ